MRKSFSLYLALLIYLPYAYAQTLSVYKLDINSGLSGGSVTSIIQDNHGYMWIGTKNGLNRYDGKDFKVFNSENSPLLVDDISRLYLDKKNRIWIGTNGGGLFKYSPKTDKFEKFGYNGEDKSLPSNVVTGIYEDSIGRMWISTDLGIALLSNQKSETYRNIAGNSISKIKGNITAFSEFEGSMWVGTSGGVISRIGINSGKAVHYKIPKAPQGLIIHKIFVRAKGEILLGTNGLGLLLFTPANSAFQELESSYSEMIIRDIHRDKAGYTWIATDGNGLYKQMIDSDELIHFEHSPENNNSLSSNAIYCVFEDKDDNIWLGTAWDGVCIIGKNSGAIDFHANELGNIYPTGVLSIYVDDETLWVGSDGAGLTVINKKTGKKNNLKALSRLPTTAYIQMIKKMPDGFYWIGTFKNGLYRLNLTTDEVIQYKNKSHDRTTISHNDVRDALQMDDDHYLIATWGGGVNLLDTRTGEFVAYMTQKGDSSSISHNNVVSLKKGAQQKIWVATYGGGLCSFDYESRHFKSFRSDVENENSLSTDNLLSLHIDGSYLWVGTWAGGLNRLDVKNGIFERFTSSTLSRRSTITAIQEGRKDDLWLSTKRGIIRYSKDNDEARSLPALREAYHINSSAIDSEGEIYFGNRKGIFSFHPREMMIKKETPRVRLNDIKLFNKSISSYQKWEDIEFPFRGDIKFLHDENTLTFDFGSLVYPTSGDVLYRVKINGQQDDWVYLGKQRSITFTNLPPRDYNIQFSASLDNKWEDNAVSSFQFTILRPWWKTTWAVILYLCFFLGFMYLFRLYTVKWEKLQAQLEIETVSREKEAEIHSIKQKFFTNISHEIRTPMTLIMGAINQIDSRGVIDKMTQESLGTVRKNGQHIIQLVSELLDFRKIDSGGVQLRIAEGNIVKFCKEVFLSFKGHAEKYNVSYTFSSSHEVTSLWYDRDQFEKVLYNLLSNAFKYTPSGGNIKVEVEANDEHVFIKIKDSGRGIPKGQLSNIFNRFYQSDNNVTLKQSGYGIGLSIVKDMIKLHAGEIDVVSKLNNGTCFTIKLIYGHNHFLPEQIITDFNDSENPNVYQVGKRMENNAEIYDGERKSLLIVEDNPEIRAYLVNILDGEFLITQAENGEEGLQMLKDKELPDLIISDVMMPKMDGITMTEKIKSNRVTSHIPVVILTARTGLIYKKEGFETGADEYLIKPFNDVMLKTRVRAILKNREVLKEKLRNDFLTAPKELALNTPDQQFLEDIIKIIEENISSEKLNADFISSELAMSHSVVYKKIKSLTGQTLVEFVRDYRLKHAAQLMVKYQLTVTDACYKVGFSDRKYFSQVFKKKFGLAPSAYIAAQRV